MKRELDIIRDLLLKIEAKNSTLPEEIVLPEINDDIVNYHLKLLMDDYYIEAEVFSYGVIYPKRLTNKGHDFLDLSKNDTAWNKAKITIKEKGVSVTLDILKEVLSAIAKSMMGLS